MLCISMNMISRDCNELANGQYVLLISPRSLGVQATGRYISLSRVKYCGVQTLHRGLVLCFRKHALNCHRMKPALFNVLCEIKEKTGK